MRFRALRGRVLALGLLCGLCAGPLSSAQADDRGDARKAFRAAVKDEDWKKRRDAYLEIADYEDADVVKEILGAMAREKNPAVILSGIGVLAGFESKSAREQLVAELRKGKASRKMYVLMVLARQRGTDAVPILLETVQGKDAPAAAQAAIALGRKEVKESLPHLLAILRHKDWQLRRAGAMGLKSLAQPPPPKPKPGEKKKAKDFKWPVPDYMKDPAISNALIAAMATSKGRVRGDLVAALEAIHEKEYGFNPDAWRMVLAGKDPDARTLKKRTWPPHAFGIPIYGRRVVLVYDNSLRAGDPHRFGSGDRMMELCEVPGGRPILSMRLRTVGQFARAHYKRCVRDMARGTQFEVIIFNEMIQRVFGKWAGPGAGSRKLLNETLDGLKEDNGIATYGALMLALDLGGAADSKAWKKGPDEIVFMTCNMPTTGDIKEADVVGAAIAMKARLRMVPIHTIGIETHPYSMLETIAKETGAIYRNYYK